MNVKVVIKTDDIEKSEVVREATGEGYVLIMDKGDKVEVMVGATAEAQLNAVASLFFAVTKNLKIKPDDISELLNTIEEKAVFNYNAAALAEALGEIGHYTDGDY